MHIDCEGFHGTTPDNANSIIKNGFEPSNEKAWFGAGIYFFGSVFSIIDGKEDAKFWVLNVKKQDKWAVIRARIESYKAFDMIMNEDHKKAFTRMREELFKLHLKAGKAPDHFKDRMVFIQIERSGSYEVIRAFVDPAKKLYLSYALPRVQIQICVKQADAIKSSEIIMQGC